MADKTAVAKGWAKRGGRLFDIASIKDWSTSVGFLPAVIVLMVVITSVIQPRFATFSNLQNVSRQASFLAILAVAEMIPILTAGFDLSQGGIIGATSVVTAILTLDLGVLPGMIGGVIFGGLLGSVNGFAIAWFRISPFVVTLGMMSVARGMALIITNGQSIYGLPPSFKYIGTGYVGPVPIPVIVAALVFFFAHILLSKTRFGRYIYAIGGNEEAARLSGINVFKYKLLAYSFCGLLTGLAAVVFSSRVNSGEPNLGLGAALESIAAVVIGGVSLFGGEGRLLGVFFGVVVLSLLSNSLNLLNVSSYLQLMAIGAVIIVAVIIDQLRYKRGR